MLALARERKTADPELSVPDLIEIARISGVIGSEQPVSRTTLWRACRRMGLPLGRSEQVETSDTRRFAYPHRMMMVLCDGKHFRAGAQRARRVVLSFIDDATRFALALRVGTAESTSLFLHGLYEATQRYGLMNALYLDHGPGFISGDTKSVVARLIVTSFTGASATRKGTERWSAITGLCDTKQLYVVSTDAPRWTRTVAL